MKNKKYLDDICEFCGSLWGTDNHDTCTTPCMCASYVNQDYIPQREATLGLPVSRPWDQTLVPKAPPNPLSKLTEEGRANVRDQLSEKLTNNPPILRIFITMFLGGATKREICDGLRIKENTYYKYIKRFRRTARGVNRRRSNNTTEFEESSNSKGPL